MPVDAITNLFLIDKPNFNVTCRDLFISRPDVEGKTVEKFFAVI